MHKTHSQHTAAKVTPPPSALAMSVYRTHIEEAAQQGLGQKAGYTTSPATAKGKTLKAHQHKKKTTEAGPESKKQYVTGDSQEITHPSTSPAQTGLSCEF